MATTSIDKEILAVEREYWDSMISKDPKVATRLTAEESLIVGAQGVSTVTSKAIGEMVKSEGWKLKKYDFSDVKVTSPAKDVAIIAYHVREELDVEGKPLTLEANDTTTWVRKAGSWVGVSHTEAVAGDPFGRDRISTRM